MAEGIGKLVLDHEGAFVAFRSSDLSGFLDGNIGRMEDADEQIMIDIPDACVEPINRLQSSIPFGPQELEATKGVVDKLTSLVRQTQPVEGGTDPFPLALIRVGSFWLEKQQEFDRQEQVST